MSENLDVSGNSEQSAEESEVVTLTLNDVLELEDEMIQDAAAVLGASNDKACSYNDVSCFLHPTFSTNAVSRATSRDRRCTPA
jgi:hypothetical protein